MVPMSSGLQTVSVQEVVDSVGWVAGGGIAPLTVTLTVAAQDSEGSGEHCSTSFLDGANTDVVDSKEAGITTSDPASHHHCLLSILLLHLLLSPNSRL